MTFQEMFDTAFAGLESQGFKKSSNLKLGGCCYRGDNGVKCAAGFLLPDNEHTDENNRTPVESHPWFSNNFNQEELTFLERLQKAHDTSAGPKSMRNLLIDLAERYNLTHPGKV